MHGGHRCTSSWHIRPRSPAGARLPLCPRHWCIMSCGGAPFYYSHFLEQFGAHARGVRRRDVAFRRFWKKEVCTRLVIYIAVSHLWNGGWRRDAAYGFIRRGALRARTSLRALYSLRRRDALVACNSVAYLASHLSLTPSHLSPATCPSLSHLHTHPIAFYACIYFYIIYIISCIVLYLVLTAAAVVLAC